MFIRATLLQASRRTGLALLAAVLGICIVILASSASAHQDTRDGLPAPVMGASPRKERLPEAPLVGIRITSESATLLHGSLLVTFEAVDADGLVPAGLRPLQLVVSLGGSCTFREALLGSLMEEPGSSVAHIALQGGRARVLVTDAVAESVEITARRSASDRSQSLASLTVRFLAPAADEDGDGLTNLDELEHHTDPFALDSDGDSVADPSDNCPNVENSDQSDRKHPNGIGDACDDPDHDGVYDLADNCLDRANPDQVDEDGDSIGDACSGRTPDTVPYALTFTLPFVATDVVFDRRRPFFYATDKVGRTVNVVNLETGLVETQFPFALMPESLALTSDGSRLFVALLTREHNSYWDWPHEGYIASIDLQTRTMERQFPITADPFDLLATSDGHLIVPDGSGQWTTIKVFDGLTGQETGKATIRQASRVSLLPSERTVYAADTDSFPSDIRRFDLVPGGAIFSRWDSPYHGDHRIDGNVWASPGGDFLITRGGDVFATGGSAATDMRFIQSMSVGKIQDLAFDAPHRFILTAEGSALHYYNLVSRVEFGNHPLSLPISFVGVEGGSIYALMLGTDNTTVVTIPHPGLAGGTNIAPIAHFTVSPAAGGTTSSDFRFDASSSSDAEDAITALRFRWDFDGDGVWDTPWSSDPVVTRKFSTPGVKVVRLQVVDSLSLPGDKIGSIVVTSEADLDRPRPSTAAFEMPFSVTDAIFDPERSYLYVSDGGSKTVSFVNLQTGVIEKQFSFDLAPESIAITPDGSRLFVALPTREHDPYWFGAHEGYIASFDLRTQVKDRQFRITEDPFDLVATSDGYLVVSSGSGQWAPVQVFNAVTGQRKGTTNYDVYEGSRLALHPSGTSVYGADSWVETWRADLQPNGGIVYRWSWSYQARVANNLWAIPRGDGLITGGGDILSVGATINTDQRFVQSFSAGGIQALAFDAPRHLILTAEGSTLRYYNDVSRLEFGNLPVSAPISFVGTGSENVYALLPGPARTVVLTISHPALTGATNNPPSTGFTVTPATGGTTLDDFRFDASSSSDGEDAFAALRFRWDFDNDGIWDTPWSGDPAVTRKFATAGTKLVRLQVLDSLGLVSEQTQMINVAFRPDPSQPRPPAPVFDLPFPVTDAAYDPGRPYLYVSDKVGKKVYFVNLRTGFVEKQFAVDRMPESLALTPDGSRLFVALLTQEHDPFWFDAHSGYIASFDLQTQTKDRQFLITEDPFDLLATSDGHLVVPSGSGQWTYIQVFDAVDGQWTGAAGILQRCRATLNASETAVYIASTEGTPAYIARYDLTAGGSIESSWGTPYPFIHRYGGKVWASPRGDLLISHGGDVFTAGDTSETDMQFVQSLAPDTINDLAWDVDRDLVFTLESNAIRRYRLSDYSLVDSVALPATGSFLGRNGPALFALVPQGTHTLLLRIPIQNHAPIADAGVDRLAECTGITGAAVSLDASASLDSDSMPGTHDDIFAFDWYENYGTPTQQLLGEGTALSLALPLGPHPVTLKVSDWAGLSNTATVTVTVADTTPPQLSIQSSPAVLWPPNHRMVPVQIPVAVTDACSTPSVVLATITSSEPDNTSSPNDGNTSNDIQGAEPGTPDFNFELRAERNGEGEGRVYRVTYGAVDGSGNRSTASSLVLVPHDQGGETEPLTISAENGAAGTTLQWEPVPGATSYKVIRGNAGSIREAGDFIDLGAVSCVTSGSVDSATDRLDPESPPIGQAFFYLVSYNDGRDSGYGSDTATKPRIKTAGGCN